MPNLRRGVPIDPPLFAAASAIPAVISCPVSVWLPNTTRRYGKPGASGTHQVNSARVQLPQKKMNTATKEQQALQPEYGGLGTSATASAGPLRHRRLAQEVGIASAAPLYDRPGRAAGQCYRSIMVSESCRAGLRSRPIQSRDRVSLRPRRDAGRYRGSNVVSEGCRPRRRRRRVSTRESIRKRQSRYRRSIVRR